MIIRTVTQNNDWTFGKGKNNYKTNLAALEQNIKTRLLFWKNDCFYDFDSGVDYNNFLDRSTKNFLDSDVKRQVLQTEGVIKINIFNSTIESRNYEAQMNILTIYGNLNIRL